MQVKNGKIRRFRDQGVFGERLALFLCVLLSGTQFTIFLYYFRFATNGLVAIPEYDVWKPFKGRRKIYNKG